MDSPDDLASAYTLGDSCVSLVHQSHEPASLGQTLRHDGGLGPRVHEGLDGDLVD